MKGLMSVLKDFYIRFLVWLGAAPPPGYEFLIREQPGPKQYTVQPGDTLFSVARKFGVNYRQIARANGLEETAALSPGQTLVIPSPGEPAEEEPPESPPAVSPPPVETPTAPPPVETKTEAPTVPPSPPPRPVEPERPPAVELEAEAPPRPVEPEIETRPAPPVEKTGAEAPVVSPPPPPRPVEPERPPAVELEAEAPPRPVEPEKPSVEEEPFRYTVQRGDTLNAIARKYGVPVERLIEANNIVNPNLIFPGQKLVIPGYLAEQAGAAPPRELARIRVQPVVGTDPDFPPQGPAEAVRALYVSYFAIGHPEIRAQIFKLLDTTEFNAVVLDAKGDHGLISYPTNLALAQEIGANRPTVKEFAGLMGALKQRRVFTIARIVVFKDPLLARHKPEYAVKIRRPDGALEVWQDADRSGWTDPFLKPVWDYNIALAVEAAKQGFDEVQFDYLRFPVPGQGGTLYFSQEASRETRLAAVNGFLSIARGQLKPYGVQIAADVFGYTCWRKDDMLIGQDIDRMGQYLDVLCPMLYPSTFGSGIPGYKNPVAHPYEVVYESARRAVERVQKTGCAVRPWIQDFADYRFDRREFGREEIQAQIRGCFDAGCAGFMVWNPRTTYTGSAYAPAKKQIPADAG
ncbi:MAG: LysM peptidoglycan-binding domain-containing protein [Chloroflexi bacterium]|nr:MAG: LysM peptidoglycan-binding domain-containing protein [Chloroflexota bacterium]